MSFADNSWCKGYISPVLTFFEVDVSVPVVLPIEDNREHDTYKVQLQDGLHQTYEQIFAWYIVILIFVLVILDIETILGLNI